jgi:hypothetical protein
MKAAYSGFDSLIELSAFNRKVFKKHVKQLLNGNLNEDELNQALFDYTFKELATGIQTSFNGIEYNKEDLLLNKELLSNTAVFSAFKSYRITGDLKTALIDDNGNRLSFDEYRKKAQQIDKKYNEEWLRSEYNLAQQQASAARQWNSFQRDKDLYPNLEYMPSLSANQDKVHKQYYGIIRPIDDAFWTTGLPPNRWGCKCWVKQTDKEPTEGEVTPLEPIPGVEGNAGKSKRVFPPNHPYVTSMSAKEKVLIQKNLNRHHNSTDADIYIKQKVSKGELSVHHLADDIDLEDNIDFAVPVLEKYKGEVQINKHSNEFKKKNPEYTYNGVIGDRAKMETNSIQSFLNNSFKKMSTQLKGNNAFIALDFNGKITKSNKLELTKSLHGRMFSRCEFVFLKNGNKVVKIMQSDDFKTKLSKIEKEL